MKGKRRCALRQGGKEWVGLARRPLRSDGADRQILSFSSECVGNSWLQFYRTPETHYILLAESSHPQTPPLRHWHPPHSVVTVHRVTVGVVRTSELGRRFFQMILVSVPRLWYFYCFWILLVSLRYFNVLLSCSFIKIGITSIDTRHPKKGLH